MFLTSMNINEIINEKKTNIVLFLDLKKAFGTVDHKKLTSKLESYGVQGDAGKWFNSYLGNCYQYCSLYGCISTAKKGTTSAKRPWNTIQ